MDEKIRDYGTAFQWASTQTTHFEDIYKSVNIEISHGRTTMLSGMILNLYLQFHLRSLDI